jgi:hypothetical protein
LEWLKMAENELFKWRLEAALKYDDAERSLGDVLDVKASVVLVAVTFLSGISAQLIVMQGLSPCWYKAQVFIQLCALILLAFAGGTIIGELWPNDYKAQPKPKEDAVWIDKLLAERTDPDAVLNTILAHKLASAVDRVEENAKINEKKSKLLFWTFKLTAGALCLVLGNLIFLAARLVLGI